MVSKIFILFADVFGLFFSTLKISEIYAYPLLNLTVTAGVIARHLPSLSRL
jgi:hypothetical protein